MVKQGRKYPLLPKLLGDNVSEQGTFEPSIWKGRRSSGKYQKKKNVQEHDILPEEGDTPHDEALLSAWVGAENEARLSQNHLGPDGEVV